VVVVVGVGPAARTTTRAASVELAAAAVDGEVGGITVL
jgi:hypothetical protein